MKKKPMQEWSREEMETWLKGTQGGSNIEGRNNKKQNVYGYRYNTSYSRTRS